MSQRGDLGYKATAVLLGESGLALALDRDQLSDLRGVLTPAAAMGDALLTRLPAAGVILGDRRGCTDRSSGPPVRQIAAA